MKRRFGGRWYAWLGNLTIALLISGIGFWGTQTTLAGAVLAPGEVVIEGRVQVVEHPDGGVVEAIYVEEGDLVVENSRLLLLDETSLRAELSIIEHQIIELWARAQRLVAERDASDPSFNTPPSTLLVLAGDVQDMTQGQGSLFDARLATFQDTRATLQERQQQIELEIEGMEAQSSSLSEELQIADEQLVMFARLLDSGLAQASQVATLRREVARLNGTLAELAAAIARNRGGIAELDTELLRLASERREAAITELRDVSAQLSELRQQQLVLQQRLARLELTAPVTGYVHDLQITSRDAVLRPAEPVMYIVPVDREQLVAVRVDTLHVDSVYPGQAAVLRFSAFQSRTTPELFAEVLRVSADALEDERTGQRYYLAYLQLNEGELERLGELVLVSGMPVEAMIRTGDRTPLEYLLQPLHDYFNRAWREE